MFVHTRRIIFQRNSGKGKQRETYRGFKRENYLLDRQCVSEIMGREMGHEGPKETDFYGEYVYPLIAIFSLRSVSVKLF